MKKVIVWSGGADSTLLLARALADENACERDTKACVAAITLQHHQLDIERIPMRSAERAARKRFQTWAKRQGWAFKSHWARFSSDLHAEGHVGQYTLWVTHLLAYAGSVWGPHSLDKDRLIEIQFGYIKRDIFWHFKAEFLDAFNAIAKLSGIDWIRPAFPLEWMEKRDVLNELHSRRVPIKSWWTCEEPTPKGKPCGACEKCREIASWKPPSPGEEMKVLVERKPRKVRRR